jgi:hypothetical protein
MSVEEQLRNLFELAGGNGPSSAAAYQRFLRRRWRRALLVRTGTGVGFAALLAAAVVVAAVLPERARPIATQPSTSAPSGSIQVRYLPGPRRAAIAAQGFELDVPTGWLVADLGDVLWLRPKGEPRAKIEVGTILVEPKVGPGRGQFYPTTAKFFGIGFHAPSGPYSYSRRPDGRGVLLGEGTRGSHRNYYVAWPYYCRPGVRCAPITRARTLQVRFYAPAAAWPEVRRVGEAIVADARPITNALPTGDTSGVRPPCQLNGVIEVVDVSPSNYRPDRPITVQLHNSRLNACHLRTALQVVVRNAAGRPLAVQGGQRPVVVEGDLPEGSADPTGMYRITWRWTNWCGPRSVRARVEAVDGPTPPMLLLQQASAPRCVDRARPSKIDVLQVVR